jgi:hypothetical protein
MAITYTNGPVPDDLTKRLNKADGHINAVEHRL